MPIVDYPLFEDVEVIEPKVYIEDAGTPQAAVSLRRAPEWVDFTDKLGVNGGQDLLLKLASLQMTTESRGGVSFQSNLSNISWYNGDRFWSRPFPLGTGTIYGRSQPTTFTTVNGNEAYFTISKRHSLTVLSGHRLKVAVNATLSNGTSIETDIAYFYIDKMTRNTQAATASMKVTSIAQPLLKNSADTIKDGGGWYRNRNIAYLVRKILEDQYRVPDWNLSDPLAGTLPSSFKIPDRVLLTTDAWEQEKVWRSEHPGERFPKADSRTLSHYGAPPEWDGSRFHEDGLITRCVGLWQFDGTVNFDTAAKTVLLFDGTPFSATTAMGPKNGDHVVVRESASGNNGSYQIKEITSTNTCTIEGKINGTTETSVPFTITVMLMGCDDQLWEYNPENETYTQIAAPTFPEATLPRVTIGGESLTHNYQRIELNRNDRFVLLAWTNPPYQESPDTIDWSYDLRVPLQICLFYRNNSGYYFRTGASYYCFPGDLILRAMQAQFWQSPDEETDANRQVYCRQAGQQLDLNNPYYAGTDPVASHLMDDVHNHAVAIHTHAPWGLNSAWLANRGKGVIIPFAQKPWLLTQDMFGISARLYHIEPALYKCIYATQLKRDYSFPMYEYDTSFPTTATIDTYYDDKTDTIVDLDVAQATPQGFNSVVDFGWDLRLPWSMYESANDSEIRPGIEPALQNAEVVIAYRDGPEITPDVYNEKAADLGVLYASYPYSFSNRVIPPGVWLFKTSGAERNYDEIPYSAGQGYHIDHWQRWRMLIAHSWGTKGAIEFCDSTVATDGIVVFPNMEAGDSPWMATVELDATNPTTPISVMSIVTASHGFYDLEYAWQDQGIAGDSTHSWVEGNYELDLASKDQAYNSYNDSFNNRDHVTHPISSCANASGDYYYLSLRYANQTVGKIDRTLFSPVESPAVDIVKYNSSTAGYATAVPTRLFAQHNDTDTYGIWTPVDIYSNPGGVTGEELMIIARNDADGFGSNYYRIFFHDDTTQIDELTPVDALDADAGIFPNKPMALTYDPSSGYWYGITAESGSLFRFPVAGTNRYVIEIVDQGWQPVQEEGYCNVIKLAIDGYTRRTPDFTTSIQTTPLTGKIGWGTGPVAGAYSLPPLSSDWVLETGLDSHLSFQGDPTSVWNYIMRIDNPGAQTWLSYHGSHLPTDFELRWDMRMYSTGGTGPAPWVDTFAVAGHWAWDRLDGAKAYWSTVNWPPGPVGVVSARASAVGLPLQLLKRGTEITWDADEVIAECYMQTPGTQPECWLVVDVRGEQGSSPFQYIGMRVIDTTAGVGNTDVDIIVQHGSFTSYPSHTFSGGANQFINAPFRMRIVRDTSASPTIGYTFYVEEPAVFGTDTWTTVGSRSEGGLLTGAVGIGGKDVVVDFNQVDVSFQVSALVHGKAGVVYANATSSADNRLEVNPDVSEIKLYAGGVAVATVTSIPLSWNTTYSFRLQKNFAGSGRIAVLLESESTTVPIIDVVDTVGASQYHGPWAIDGTADISNYQVYTGSSVSYDENTRAIVYGISAPTFHYDYARGDERIAGKYYLWKYDVYYSSRIPLADFNNMKQWKALEELARVCNYTMGFVLDDFFFVPRLNATDNDVIFRKHPSEHGVANIRKMTIDEGLDEVYNYCSVTPGLAVLQQPSWNLIFQNRTEEEYEALSFELSLEQRDTRQQNVRLICTRPGRLVPEQGDKVTPQFSYFIIGGEIEAFLTARKEFNVAPFEIIISESTVGINTGDLLEINVENDNGESVLLTAEVSSVEDQEDGGHVLLTDKFLTGEDWPSSGLSIGTTVHFRTQGHWSSTNSNPQVPRFWPWEYDVDGNITYPGLQSGKLYRVGLTNVYLRVSDLLWEQNARRFVRFLDTASTENLDEKKLYVEAVKTLQDFRQGDIIELNMPGTKLEMGERLTQSAINLTSSKDYGKRQYPITQMKFLLPKQAQDMTRRIIRDFSFPRGIYQITVGFNPLIGFLDPTEDDRLQIFGVQDSEEFEYSPNQTRYGHPRTIAHDPSNFTTTVTLKDEDEY